MLSFISAVILFVLTVAFLSLLTFITMSSMPNWIPPEPEVDYIGDK